MEEIHNFHKVRNHDFVQVFIRDSHKKGSLIEFSLDHTIANIIKKIGLQDNMEVSL